MSDRSAPLSLAVVGAGAVVEKRYLPAAEQIEGVQITHIVDLDLEHAERMADLFHVPAASSDLEEVLPHVDAVVVATPPSSHASISMAALQSGVHVLCEKPMTASVEDARELTAAAARSDAVMSVAMVRRVGRGVEVLKRFLDRGLLGAIHTVRAEEGGEFNWPLRTGHIFESPAEGGVLRDTGTHIIDLVLWACDGKAPSLTGYTDDSWGGAEANAQVDFEFERGEQTVRASVEVSFTRNLENRLRVFGDGGCLESTTSGGVEALFTPAGSTIPIALKPADARPGSRTDDFIRQLEIFVAAIRSGGKAPVPAAEALPIVELIDSCYRGRTRTVLPWQAAPTSGVRS